MPVKRVRFDDEVGSDNEEEDGDNTIPILPKQVTKKKRTFFNTRPRQVLGVIRRKFTQIVRNPVLLTWEVLVPTIQILLFMLAIGQQPHNLPVVVRNGLEYFMIILSVLVLTNTSHRLLTKM